MTTLYRATTNIETGIPSGTCWTEAREAAEAYTDNPGFGGNHIREIQAEGSVLDITGGGTRDQFCVLADAIGMTTDDAQDWMDSGYLYPWEESGSVRNALIESAYIWLRYEDDYPDDCITWMKIA